MNEKLVKASPFIQVGASLIMAGAAILLVRYTKKLDKLNKKKAKAVKQK